MKSSDKFERLIAVIEYLAETVEEFNENISVFIDTLERINDENKKG